MHVPLGHDEAVTSESMVRFQVLVNETFWERFWEQGAPWPEGVVEIDPPLLLENRGELIVRDDAHADAVEQVFCADLDVIWIVRVEA